MCILVPMHMCVHTCLRVHVCLPSREGASVHLFSACVGVAKAVDAVVDHLKKISRDVTTPEEITQVCTRNIVLLI